MEEVQRYIKEKTALLEKFLDMTEKIVELFKLDVSNDENAMVRIQFLVDKREEIIDRIKEVNANIEESTGGNQAAFKKEYESQIAFWVELLEKIKTLEELNMKSIEQMMGQYMEKVRTTKDSIRVLGAYQKQMSYDTPANIDKRN